MAIVTREAEGAEPRYLSAGHWIGYLMPFMISVGAYFFAPPLRRNVFSVIPPEEYLYFFVAMIIVILLCVMWIFIDFYVVSDIRSSGDRIKENIRITYWTAIAFSGAAVWFAATDKLPWWLAIVAVFALGDGEVISNRGANSALLKRVLQEEGTH